MKITCVISFSMQIWAAFPVSVSSALLIFKSIYYDLSFYIKEMDTTLVKITCTISFSMQTYH